MVSPCENFIRNIEERRRDCGVIIEYPDVAIPFPRKCARSVRREFESNHTRPGLAVGPRDLLLEEIGVFENCGL